MPGHKGEKDIKPSVPMEESAILVEESGKREINKQTRKLQNVKNVIKKIQ